MIKIKKTIGYNYRSDLDDIKTVKKSLNQLGYYKEPTYGITPYADENLFDAIKYFQKDKNLKIDGVMYPDGETLASLNKKLSHPEVKGPSFRCSICGGFHGGVYGDVCPDCKSK